jgi:hypothetical protein
MVLVVDPPAEHGLAERLRSGDVSRVQLAPGEAAVLVAQLGADVLVRLPGADHAADGMGEEGQSAGAGDRGGREEGHRAGVAHALREAVEVVGVDVGRPRDGLAVAHQRADPGHALAALGEERVAAGLLRRAGVDALPAEEVAVERLRGVRVGGSQVRPARGAGLV